MSLSRRDQELILRQIDASASPSERHALEMRLREDVEVRRYFESVQSTVDALEGLHPETPQVDLVGRAEARWKLEQAAGTSSRLNLRLGLAFGSALAVAGAAAYAVFVTPTEIQPAPLAAPAMVQVISVSGDVFVELEGGVRARLLEGTLPSGRLRVLAEEQGTATLRASAGASLVVHANTALAVDADADRSLHLVHGLFEVDSRASASPLSLHTGDATIHVDKAQVGVLRENESRLVVACHAGAARVTGERGALSVGANERAVFLENEAPRVEAMAAELVLRVAAANGAHNQVVLRGATEAGAQVLLDGKAVAVNARGEFELVVTLTKEPRTLRMVARNAAAQQKEQVVALSALSPRPDKGVKKRRLETEWEWESGTPPG